MRSLKKITTFFVSVVMLSTAAVSLAAGQRRPLTIDALTEMSQGELNHLYAAAVPGDIPDGQSEGRAMFFPGNIINQPATMLAMLFWQGKIFNREEGILTNRVFGFSAIAAEVYYGESYFDGGESIIIDYSDTSLLAQPVRDEIRLIAPNLYLGRAYIHTLLGPWMAVNFALEFPREE
jgi:hypothetical protein